jgi:Flp pilus assembly protein CpaB
MKKMKLVLLTAVMAVCAAGANAEDLNMKVPPGYRATVVPADKAEFLFIKPGDRLDMLVTFDAQMKDNSKEKVTASILQNVLVLDTVCKGGVYAVVLALNPNEAQYAMLSLGYQVHFTIRGKGDTEMHPMEIASFRRLIKGDSDDKPAKKEEPAKPADK